MQIEFVQRNSEISLEDCDAIDNAFVPDCPSRKWIIEGFFLGPTEFMIG